MWSEPVEEGEVVVEDVVAEHAGGRRGEGIEVGEGGGVIEAPLPIKRASREDGADATEPAVAGRLEVEEEALVEEVLARRGEHPGEHSLSRRMAPEPFSMGVALSFGAVTGASPSEG